MGSLGGRELAIHLDAVELALAEQLAARDGVTVDELISRTMHDALVERFRIVRQQQRPATVVPFKRPRGPHQYPGVTMTDEIIETTTPTPEVDEATAEVTEPVTETPEPVSETTEPETVTQDEPTAEATDVADELSGEPAA